MSKTNTIEIVIPEYIDALILKEENLSKEKMIGYLTTVGKYSITRVQTTANEYLRFLCNRLVVYEYTEPSGLYLRNARGNELAKLKDKPKRKYKMLEYLRSEHVFSRFFDFTRTERTEKEITSKPPFGFNPATGRSLIKWGVWLGATLYLPYSERYRSFTSPLSPSHAEFWASFVDAYRLLQKQSHVGTVRFNISIPEVRAAVCVSMEIMPLTFDQLLTELVESGAYIQMLELVGMPQHKLPNIQRKHLEPLIIRNKAYYYVIVH